MFAVVAAYSHQVVEHRMMHLEALERSRKDWPRSLRVLGLRLLSFCPGIAGFGSFGEPLALRSWDKGRATLKQVVLDDVGDGVAAAVVVAVSLVGSCKKAPVHSELVVGRRLDSVGAGLLCNTD